MKNKKLLEEYIASEGANCPSCNATLVAANGDKCPGCGETIELTIKARPRLSYSWKTGFWYAGVPVGWIFLAGFLLGVAMPIIILKILDIL